MNKCGENKSFLEGNGIIILILFFLMNGCGFGGNYGYANSAAMQGALTRAELFEGLNNQDLQSSVKILSGDVNHGFDCVQMAMNNGFNSVNGNIASLGFQMANQCCDIKNAVHSEGEATRALIQSNTIQGLRDQIADKDRELLATGLVTAQTIQTNNLQNFIRQLTTGCPCS